MPNWQRRYKQLKGPWPDPDSPAGRGMTRQQFHALELGQRGRNVLQAVWFANHDLPAAVFTETGEALDETVKGILPGILTALVVVTGSSLLGISAGAVGGAIGLGVGAVPGAVAGGSVGFSAGMWILEWMGLAFLATHIGQNLHQVTSLLKQGFDEAWGRGARDWSGLTATDFHRHEEIPGFSEVTSASKKFARAVAVLIRLVLESIVVYLAGSGAAKLPELIAQLKHSRLGSSFGKWVEIHHQELMCNPKCNKSGGAAKRDSRPNKVVATDAPEQPKPKNNKQVLLNQEASAAQARLADTGGATLGQKDFFIVDREGVPIGARQGIAKPGLPARRLLKEGWPDLPASEARNFNSAEPITLKPGTKIYRVIDDSSNPAGAYWLENIPGSRVRWRHDYAVKTVWNTNGKYVEYEVPEGPGLKVWRGEASAQQLHEVGFHYPGGGQQIWMPPNTITPTFPKTTGW